MKVTIQVGTPSLLERGDMVWEKVNSFQAKNVIVQCEDDDGNVIHHTQVYDPNASPFEGIQGYEQDDSEEDDGAT